MVENWWRGDEEVQRIQREYFEDVYNVDTQGQVAVYMCDFDGIQKDNYFGGEPIGRVEVEMRVGKLKNLKATGKDEITGELIKGGGDRVVDWVQRLCNMTFESGVVPEDWRSAVIVTLNNGKGERNECKNY